MTGLKLPQSEKLLLGSESSDDAGIYQINEKQALVQTVDIITPVVDDPYIFGKIAAANSLSDVWAMGGRVITALNLVAYDNCHLSLEHLRAILAGGADKVAEADGVIAGGHTIEDSEMKYGLCITGLVHPQKFLRNNTIKPGDKIILTKPLGMGVITTAVKGELVDDDVILLASRHMEFLNKYASEIALANDVNAITDVTGFGLLGHLCEMLNKENSIELSYNSLPFIKAAFELAEMGMFPAGAYRNESYYQEKCRFDIKLPDSHRMLLHDPQTSGGLLLSIKEERADEVLRKLHDAGIEEAAVIASVIPSSDGFIRIVS